MKKFNEKEFINSINTYENFKNYDDIIYFLECKSKDFINDYLQKLADYGIKLNDSNIDDIINELESFDYISEIADSEVDIYYHDIYKSTSAFSEFINEAQNEFGQAESIDKQIQQGQYYFYDQVYNMIHYELIEYFKNLIN